MYVLEFDGASRGNPGLAGSGAALRESSSQQIVCRMRCFLGRKTNNEAEYTALIEGLKMASRLGVARLTARGDSKLVVMQVAGRWQVNKEHLQVLHAEAVAESRKFTQFSIEHVLREWNTEADKLSNEAIDQQYA